MYNMTTPAKNTARSIGTLLREWILTALVIRENFLSSFFPFYCYQYEKRDITTYCGNHFTICKSVNHVVYLKLIQGCMPIISQQNWEKIKLKMWTEGTSLEVQWLRLCAPNAWVVSSISGQGTRPHRLQLKIPSTATKSWHSQINKYF